MPKWLIYGLLTAITIAPAPGALTRVNNPQGGVIEYGPIDGQTTEAGGMGNILRSIHQQFGDRPQVGKLFQVRGTQSVAAFFSVNKRTQGNGRLAGLIVVTKVASDRVEAGMISDDASHFGATFNPMMKTLFASWHPFQGAPEATSARTGPAAPPESLHQFVLQDRTASVDLPAGWKVNPSSAGGSIMAEGPDGEEAVFGFDILVADLNNPGARRTYQTVMQGGLRGTAYAQQIYYPLGHDLAKAFVDIIAMFRQKRNLPPRPFEIKTTAAVAAPPGQWCIHLTGIADAQEPKKAMDQNTVFCVTRPSPAAGVFQAIVNSTAVPMALADKERATMGAVMASFRVDMARVQGMANAYAAPAIGAIQAVGRAAADQARAAHERNEIQNSSVYQHWDSMDRRSKEFSNYQLGYSVVQDNYNNAHGTLWNEDADALVKHDPQRFEYVNAPNFWKGIDY